MRAMSLPEIKAKRIEHRGVQKIGLYFKYNDLLIAHVKKLNASRWSGSKKCWHIPEDEEIIDLLLQHFRGKAFINYSELLKRKPVSENKQFLKSLPQADAEDHELTRLLRKWMEHRRYSSSTVNTYCGMVLTFIRFMKPAPVANAVNEDVVRFTNEYILVNGLSSSYQNQAINGIKLFFREVVKSNIEVENIERPRREYRLPNVLSKEEVKAILGSPTNLKHKAMLSLVYACGLRRSEVLNLLLIDVDSKRGLLIIRNAKGKKDRVVPLSDKIVQLLRQYFIAFRPVKWLFEGRQRGEQYSEKSLQSVLKQSLLKAEITKPVSLHWLRHSYATHLLESGTDLRYIQEILGHKSSRTTEIYTHVSTQNLQKIKSPYDNL